MADIFSKEKRSEVMSKIRGKNTKIEIFFCKALSKEVYPLGYRYRRHYKKIPGSPDVVFVSQRIAVFVDGDFWHGKNFKTRKAKLPKKYWQQKIEDNITRDRRVNRKLRRESWKVIRFWESDIRKDPAKVVRKVMEVLEES